MTKAQRSALRIYGGFSVIFWLVPFTLPALGEGLYDFIIQLLKMSAFPIIYTGMAVGLADVTATKMKSSKMASFYMAAACMVFAGAVQSMFIAGGILFIPIVALFSFFGLLPSAVVGSMFIGSLEGSESGSA